MMSFDIQSVFAILCLFLAFPEFFLIGSFLILVFVGFFVFFAPVAPVAPVVSVPVVSVPVVSVPVVSVSVVSVPVVSVPVVSVPVVSVPVVSVPTSQSETKKFIKTFLPDNLKKNFLFCLTRFQLDNLITEISSSDETIKAKFEELTKKLKTFIDVFSTTVSSEFTQSKLKELDQKCDEIDELVCVFKKDMFAKKETTAFVETIDKFLHEFRGGIEEVKCCWRNSKPFNPTQ